MVDAGAAPVAKLAELEARGALALGFYDLTCPFCYVAQGKRALLAGLGVEVVELPFAAHPEIPAAGVMVGERQGPMYEALTAAAHEAGLPLRWPARLPNSRQALAAAEWVRLNEPEAAERYRAALFAAHFAEGAAIDDLEVLIGRAAPLGVDAERLRTALAAGAAEASVAASERLGRMLGVRGTPSWARRGRLLVGNRPAAEFERFVAKS